MKISAEGQKNSIRITNDQSQYWSDKSKGYAEDAKKSATEAKGYADAASASVIEANNIVKDFDAHVVTKTNEFDEHTVAKQEEFDTHASVKQNDFDVNAANVTARFDNNYLDKTKDFNTNATNKTSAFDSNATLKTNAFNNNATAKTAIIDSKIEQAELAETNANIWAEGSDTQVRSLGGEHSSKGWNGVVSQTATAGVSSINNSTKDGVDLLNRTATNIAKEKYNNSAKGYLTGEVSTDEIMVNQLVDMKHSTFDKSKFTVVGTPTITDDGIASGFNGNNYLRTDSISNITGEEITINCNFTTPSKTPSYVNPLFGSNKAYIFKIYFYKNNKLQMDCGNGTSWTQVDQFISTLQLNTNYNLKAIFNSNKIKIYIDNVLKKDLDIISPIEMSIRNIAYYIGSAFGVQGFLGSIDLKQFSIQVDGKEVFNGNKTGIDIIKPDNFTKVGNPTISEDGVASNFSGKDYLTLSMEGKLNNNYNFEVDSKVKYTSDTTLEQEIWEIFWTFRCRIIINNGKHRLDFHFPYASNYTNINFILEDYDFVDGDDLYIKCISENASSRKLMISKNGIDWITKNGDNVATDKDLTVYNLLQIGRYTNDVWWKSSIDLNEFRVYVDGNLVYQPLLRIPYTQSSTGSKIVDSNYRDRVQDVHKQYGNALYYTLDENNKNCTLPMGELYGLIDVRRLVSCTRTDETFLEVYSDGTVVQGGKCTANTLVNLSRVYEGDKTYNLTVPYSAKNKSSFTPTVTGDWVAYGKGEL